MKIHKWSQIARPEQLMPKGHWNIWLILAGRGFGKTRAAAEAILEIINRKQCTNIGVMGITVFEAREIMIEGTSGILKNASIKYKYLPSRRRIEFSNGVIVQYFGADRYENLRGFQFDWIWIDEFAKFKNCQEVLEQCFLCLRLGESKIIITTTPQNKSIIKELMSRSDVYVTRGSSFENNNLSDNFKSNLEKFKGTSIEKQEVYGQIIDENIWKTEHIKYRQPQNIEHFVLGVDPAVENGTTGIVLIGIKNREIYVLEDYSESNKVALWMDKILKISEQIVKSGNFLEIVIEINQGGQMIKELMHQFNIKVPIIEKRAFCSKKTRNQELNYLYEKIAIYHSKIMPRLEKELMENPKDIADALYWAVKYASKYTFV